MTGALTDPTVWVLTALLHAAGADDAMTAISLAIGSIEQEIPTAAA